jgi:peptidoglycan/xylan/chitin deacetylase (PgdA/CDA1 family)
MEGPTPTGNFRRGRVLRRRVVSVVLALAALVAGACAPTPPPTATAPPEAPPAPPPPRAAAAPPPPPETLPETFESSDFIVALARAGDTAERLAARHLGSAARAWMITDFGGAASFAARQTVVIPRRQWNPPGVYPHGYQVVPVLAYGPLAADRRARGVVSAAAFDEQMRDLKAGGYHVLALDEFVGYLRQERQVPRKSVVLTFDDAHRGFVQHARPVLQELGFPAVLFVATGAVAARPGASALTWPEIAELSKSGVDVQSASRSARDLRRASSEADSAYSRRMQQELETPLDLLRKNVSRLSSGVETLAYPLGRWDEDLIRYARQYGYSAAFSVAGDANPAFVHTLKISRIQVSADWTLADFKKSLVTFREQAILMDRPPEPPPALSSAAGDRSTRRAVAAPHLDWSRQLEERGLLRQALDECQIARTIDPGSAPATERCTRLQTRIPGEATARLQEGVRLARTSPGEARTRFLAALAVDPSNAPAFDALRNTAALPAKFLSHTVRAQETSASLADLYYGDRARADLIEQANGLAPGAPLPVGKVLRIPEISGIPFLRPDR